MRLTGQKSGETTTSNPTPHQFYIQKKIDRPPRRFNPLILPKNHKRPSVTHPSQTNTTTKKSDISPKASNRDGTRRGEGVGSDQL